MSDLPATQYKNLLAEIKGHIQHAQTVHTALVRLYKKIGGAIIVPQVAKDGMLESFLDWSSMVTFENSVSIDGEHGKV